MPNQLCPVCSCTIVDEGYEKKGILYCCEPCDEGAPVSVGAVSLSKERSEFWQLR